MRSREVAVRGPQRLAQAQRDRLDLGEHQDSSSPADSSTQKSELRACPVRASAPLSVGPSVCVRTVRTSAHGERQRSASGSSSHADSDPSAHGHAAR